MNYIDEIHNDFGGFGIKKINDRLKKKYEIYIGLKKTKSYMEKMNILKKANDCEKYVKYPYLLNKLIITRPNQVWSLDISYIGMKEEYAYLVAIIDWYSRFIISWNLSLTLNVSQVMKAIKEGVFQYGKPDIINTDQGSQFMSATYLEHLYDNNIQISMNRGWNLTDNICIERFFKSLKSEKLYTEDIKTFNEAQQAIEFYIPEYNFYRGHSALSDKTPSEIYGIIDNMKKQHKKLML